MPEPTEEELAGDALLARWDLTEILERNGVGEAEFLAALQGAKTELKIDRSDGAPVVDLSIFVELRRPKVLHLSHPGKAPFHPVQPIDEEEPPDLLTDAMVRSAMESADAPNADMTEGQRGQWSMIVVASLLLAKGKSINLDAERARLHRVADVVFDSVFEMRMEEAAREIMKEREGT